MRTVDIIQRTPEWHDWRRQGVTASDAGVLLGTDPDRTVWRLWAEKVGLVDSLDPSRNPLVRAGIDNESLARQQYEATYDAVLLPLCGESDEHRVLRASFDGIESDGSPVELKCPSEKVFEETKSRGRDSDAYKRYYPQLQHQIYVAGADAGRLALYRKGDLLVLDVGRDNALIAHLIEKALSFWERVENRIEPAKDPARDVYVPTGEVLSAWIRIADEYRLLEQERLRGETEVKRVEKRQGALENQLVGLMSGFARGAAAGLLVTRYMQAGGVDYRKVVEAVAPGLDPVMLEQYRRPASERVRVTFTDIEAKPENQAPLDVAQLCADDGEQSLYF